MICSTAGRRRYADADLPVPGRKAAGRQRQGGEHLPSLQKGKAPGVWNMTMTGEEIQTEATTGKDQKDLELPCRKKRRTGSAAM